jgi:hypothetical protein
MGNLRSRYFNPLVSYVISKLSVCKVHTPYNGLLRSKHVGALVIFFSMALPASSGPWPIIQFRNNFSQTVSLLGRVISASQGLYLNTG